MWHRVSIPQAVGVVATWLSEKQKLDASVGFQYRERQVLLQPFVFRAFFFLLGFVSIPRAVGVVATLFRAFFFMLGYVVSIPRAVGVVATFNR